MNPHPKQRMDGGAERMDGHITMRAPAHYRRVDLSDPCEAEYWYVVLDATRARLEAAIAQVGRDAEAIRDWLRQSQAA